MMFNLLLRALLGKEHWLDFYMTWTYPGQREMLFLKMNVGHVWIEKYFIRLEIERMLIAVFVIESHICRNF